MSFFPSSSSSLSSYFPSTSSLSSSSSSSCSPSSCSPALSSSFPPAYTSLFRAAQRGDLDAVKWHVEQHLDQLLQHNSLQHNSLQHNSLQGNTSLKKVLRDQFKRAYAMALCNDHEAVVRYMCNYTVPFMAPNMAPYMAPNMAPNVAPYMAPNVAPNTVFYKEEHKFLIPLRGMTPIAHASKAGSTRVIQALVDLKARLADMADGSWSAMRDACRFGHKHTVKWLVGAGASVVGPWHQHPLFVAAESGRATVVQWLLRSNATYSSLRVQQGPHQYTPLGVAQSMQDIRFDDTPLDVVRRAQCGNVVRLLTNAIKAYRPPLWLRRMASSGNNDVGDEGKNNV
jgi:hypothetical protein